MSTSGILEWTNEHSTSAYPLTKPTVVSDFLVDASFVQFDAFVPVLKTINVSATAVTLTITLDVGDIAIAITRPGATYSHGHVEWLMHSGQNVGTLVFGSGLRTIFDRFLDTTLKVNTPFIPTCVRSVASSGGVYSVAGAFGAVTLGSGSSPETQTVFFDVDGQDIVWHAGYLPPASVETPLLTLNNVPPTAGALFIEESDLVKITPQGNQLRLSVPVPAANAPLSPAVEYEGS